MDILDLLKEIGGKSSFDDIDFEGGLLKDILSQNNNIVATQAQKDAAESFGKLFPNAPQYGDDTLSTPPMGEGNVDPRTIDVNGINRRSANTDPSVDEEPRQLGNVSQLLEAQAAADNAPERKKGYFGTKGTLRNILGTISDAFLVQGGAEAQYAPLRERERMADAMTGFTQNPDAAAERMAYGGFADGAIKVQNNAVTQQQKAAELQGQNAGRESLDKDRQWTNIKEGRNQVARWYSAATTPERMLIAQRYTEALAKRLGVPVSELGSPQSEDERAVLSAGDMTVNQQQMLPLAERRTATGERNADTSRINATRPRPGPAPRQPRAQTDEERLERAYNTPPAQRSEYQKSLIERKERVGRGTGRSSNRREVSPPPRAGWGVRPL